MSKRNISNGNEIQDITSNHIAIQSQGVGLVVYNADITNPFFQVDSGAGMVSVDGDMIITGNANINSINVSEFDSGMLITAGDNDTGDVIDIGLSGHYFNGTSIKYTGIIRDASDILQRWVLFKNIDILPTNTVEVITSAVLDSLRLNAIYVNDGTASAPAIVFDEDANRDTGFYRIGENVLGVAAGGAGVLSIGAANSTFTNGQILNVGSSGTSSSLNVYGLATIAAGLTVTTGLSSLQALTATGLTVTSGATAVQALTAAGLITVSTGTVTAPSIVFAPDITTGLYRIGTNNIGISVGGVKKFDISSTLTQITTDLLTTAGYRRNTSANAGTSVTLTTADNFIEFTSGSAVTVTLPSIVGNAGREYTLIRAGAGIVTVNTASGSEFIDDGVTTSVSLSATYNRVTLVCGSIQWYSM